MLYLDIHKFQDYSSKKKILVSGKKSEVIRLLRKELRIGPDYEIFFTNSIYEAYALIIHSIVKAYSQIKKNPPIICNKMEDPLILNILTEYNIVWAQPKITGEIDPIELAPMIKKSKPALLIGAQINLYTGATNDVQQLSRVAHEYKIPFFCDCTYALGKMRITADPDLDILTASLTPKLSFLAIKKDLLEGYGLAKYDIKFDPRVEQHNIAEAQTYGEAAAVVRQAHKNLGARIKKVAKARRDILSKVKWLPYTEFVKCSQAEPDLIVFGEGVPHILACLPLEEKKFTNLRFVELDPAAFAELGITPAWLSRIKVLGFSDQTKKNAIDKFVAQIKKN